MRSLECECVCVCVCVCESARECVCASECVCVLVSFLCLYACVARNTPVDDASVVEVVDSLDELPNVLPDLLLGEGSVGDNVVEDLAARGELCDEAKGALCLDDFVEFDYVRVAELPHDLCLAVEVLADVLLLDVGLADDLDGDLEARDGVGAELHLGKGALAERLPEDVVAYAVRGVYSL